MKRVITPEILDSLPADDPGAKRSRRDLQRINAFMGNMSWLLKNLPEQARSISELGAGDGRFADRLSREHPQADVWAYDLQPKSARVAERIQWVKGDVLKQPKPGQGGVLIANLILHHFNDDELRDLGTFVRAFDVLIINEPRRAHLPLWLAKLATPFLNAITRHDMRVSIEAGFEQGEMPELLGLSQQEYKIHESSTWRGSQRMLAYRR
jgi:hypothetical protein